MVGSAQIAEDMVQETWIRLIGLRNQPKQEIHNPVGLLIQIARNLCLDHIKSQRKRQSLDNLYEQASGSYTMRELTAREEIVRCCLDQLSFDYRETLVLNMYSGYTFEEIASMLGKSPDAIWARASRARKKLRELVVAEIERDEQALKIITQRKQR